MPKSARHIFAAGRWLRALVLATTIIGLVAFIALLAWARQVVPTDRSAKFALDSDEAVAVTQGDWIEFRPRDTDSATGVIFYPGGKAEPVAYAPMLHALAARGFLVVLCPMPLNLALLGSERAARVMPRFPEIKRWVLAGHSLGGVMAAEFAERHAAQVAGLLLWASYPAAFTNLAGQHLAVLTIFGTMDALATPTRIAQARWHLPPQSAYVPIKGGDHWGFGNFDPKLSVAAIPREAQHTEILDATQAFLERLAPAAGATEAR